MGKKRPMIYPAIALLAALAAAAASGARTEPLGGAPTKRLVLPDASKQDNATSLRNLPRGPTDEEKLYKDLPLPKLGPEYTPQQLHRLVRAPVEYDNRFYKGNLTITRVATEKEVSKLCPATSYPYKLGCAHHDGPKLADGSWTNCRVIIVADDVIAKANLTEETVYQHELAHCMGWDGNHIGARLAAERVPLNWLGLPASVRRGLGISTE